MALLSRDNPFNGHWYSTIFAPPPHLFERQQQQYYGRGYFDADEDDDQVFNNMDYGMTAITEAFNRNRISHMNNDDDDDDDQYQVLIDVKHFTPEEITVKSVDDVVTVEGHHEEKPDEHGSILRSFKRRYILPENVNPESVQCRLSADGVLKLQAPRASTAVIVSDKAIERPVPILGLSKPVRAMPSGGGGGLAHHRKHYNHHGHGLRLQHHGRIFKQRNF